MMKPRAESLRAYAAGKGDVLVQSAVLLELYGDLDYVLCAFLFSHDAYSAGM